jgi:hypothetical protein
VVLPTGIEVKLNRAKSHLTELEHDLRSLESACRHAVRQRRDSATDEVVLYLDGLPEIDPRLSAILGDAVHNLRSVLDHLADALVRRYGGTPNDRTQFPIRLVPLSSGDTPGIPGCGSLPRNVRDRIDAVQPYRRTRPDLHQLHILNELDITDKHSELLLAVFYVPSVGWFGDMEITGFHEGPYQDGDELGRWKVRAGPGSTPVFVFKVGLLHPAVSPFARHNIAQWLTKQVLHYLQRVVLAQFEPFLWRPVARVGPPREEVTGWVRRPEPSVGS